MTTTATLVFLAVIGARFVVPLFIPRCPLPAIVVALVLDGVDQTIFQAFGYDPPGYQGYDKAMDVFYLAVAYLSTMRNWASRPAVDVARFLFFYRLAGVVLFEFTGWRPMLLIFPNTFEYFFIAYELIRLRRDPTRYGLRWWSALAAAIWILIKLPQEYWIHIARLDVTDLVARYPGQSAALAVLAAGIALAAWAGMRSRLPRPDWSWRIRPDPAPAGSGTGAQRSRWVIAHGLLSVGTAEKVVLVGLLSVIYAEVLPGLRTTGAELFLGVAAFVVVNAAITLWVARRSAGLESILAAFATRVMINIVLVFVAAGLLGRRELNPAPTLFFVLLFSLITLLDDWYRPIYSARFAAGAPAIRREGGQARPAR